MLLRDLLGAHPYRMLYPQLTDEGDISLSHDPIESLKELGKLIDTAATGDRHDETREGEPKRLAGIHANPRGAQLS